MIQVPISQLSPLVSFHSSLISCLVKAVAAHTACVAHVTTGKPDKWRITLNTRRFMTARSMGRSNSRARVGALRTMLLKVLGICHYAEVFNPIIERVAVLVVDQHPGRDWTISAFPHMPVSLDPFRGVPDLHPSPMDAVGPKTDTHITDLGGIVGTLSRDKAAVRLLAGDGPAVTSPGAVNLLSPPRQESVGTDRAYLRCSARHADLLFVSIADSCRHVNAGYAPLTRACLLEGRRYLGAEIDPARHAEALARLAQVRA